jgi:hypothetical protein
MSTMDRLPKSIRKQTIAIVILLDMPPSTTLSKFKRTLEKPLNVTLEFSLFL